MISILFKYEFWVLLSILLFILLSLQFKQCSVSINTCCYGKMLCTVYTQMYQQNLKTWEWKMTFRPASFPCLYLEIVRGCWWLLVAHLTVRDAVKRGQLEMAEGPACPPMTHPVPVSGTAAPQEAPVCGAHRSRMINSSFFSCPEGGC